VATTITADLTPSFKLNGVFSNGRPDVVIIENFDWKNWSYSAWEQMVDAGPRSVLNSKGGSISVPYYLHWVFLQNQHPDTWWRIKHAEGQGFYNGGETNDLLDPVLRAALNARLRRIFVVETPLTGFPDPLADVVQTVDYNLVF